MVQYDQKVTLYNFPKAGITVPDNYKDLLRWWAKHTKPNSYISDPNCPIDLIFAEFAMFNFNRLALEKFISSPYED